MIIVLYRNSTCFAMQYSLFYSAKVPVLQRKTGTITTH